MDAAPPRLPTIVHHHDNRQDVRNLTYHPPFQGDVTMMDIPISRRFTEFAGQQHHNLQTDEDMRQLQSHNLPYDDSNRAQVYYAALESGKD